MAVNVKVTKNTKENSLTMVRRFTKRVQQSGVLAKARANRFFKRNKSAFVEKKDALRSIDNRNRYEKMAKEGKLPQPKGRRR